MFHDNASPDKTRSAKRLRDAVNSYAFLATAMVVILFSLLNLTGLLNGVQFLRDRVPTMTLTVLGITLGYLALERRDKLDAMESRLQETQKLMQDMQVRLLNPSMLGIEIFETRTTCSGA